MEKSRGNGILREIRGEGREEKVEVQRENEKKMG